MVSPHGLKPCCAALSPCMRPTDVCHPLRGPQRMTVGVVDRPLQGGEIRAADVGFWVERRRSPDASAVVQA